MDQTTATTTTIRLSHAGAVDLIAALAKGLSATGVVLHVANDDLFTTIAVGDESARIYGYSA